MQNLFSYWKLFRYIVCAITATWGFTMIFTQGVNSGGKTLLFIAAIGVGSTILLDMFNKHMLDKKKPNEYK